MKKRLCSVLLCCFAVFILWETQALAKTPTTLTRDDDLTVYQWGFSAAFSESENGPVDMRIPSWNSPEGNMDEEILVAVLDGGIDYNHPDLKDRIYLFSEEEQEALGCSAYGYDAVAGDNSVPPVDIHGTHVAGIIGASWNDFGVSGAASNVRFINVNVCVGDTTPVEYTLRAYDFLLRALDYGLPIRLVNNSWGNLDTSLALLPLLEEAGKRGALSFFAAGNDASDLEYGVFYPVQYAHDSPYVVIVGAYDANGEHAYFSNYGEAVVDVFAPGYDILSTVTNASGQGYDFRSGTSMATPAALGACAVLAARHPEITDAGALKTLFLSCTRPLPTLSYVSANGIVDLSVDERHDFNPVIESVFLSGNRLEIRGAHFGSAGTLLVSDVSNDDRTLSYDPATLVWTDTQIQLLLDGEAKGLIRVRVKEALFGKFDAQLVLGSPTDALYDESMVLPGDFGERALFDSAADYQAAGYLCGIGDALYYMPLRFVEENGDLSFDLLYRYDLKEMRWEQMTSLPERVSAIQGTVWEETILLAGMNEDASNARIYQYDPELDSWMELPAQNVPHRTTIVHEGGTLYLVGGASVGADGMLHASSQVLTYDPESGDVAHAADLALEVYDAQVVSDRNGTLYIYGSTPGFTRPTQSLQRLQDHQAEVLTEAFPPFVEAEGLRKRTLAASLHGALCASPDGLFLVGPRSLEKKADTYFLPAGESSFDPLPRVASDAQLLWPCACIYEDTLYVIARSFIEPDHQIFRKIALRELLP